MIEEFKPITPGERNLILYNENMRHLQYVLANLTYLIIWLKKNLMEIDCTEKWRFVFNFVSLV